MVCGSYYWVFLKDIAILCYMSLKVRLHRDSLAHDWWLRLGNSDCLLVDCRIQPLGSQNFWSLSQQSRAENSQSKLTLQKMLMYLFIFFIKYINNEKYWFNKKKIDAETWWLIAVDFRRHYFHFLGNKFSRLWTFFAKKRHRGELNWSRGGSYNFYNAFFLNFSKIKK